MSRRSISQRLLLLGCALATVACPSLPKNFESLPLSEKISTYEAHFRNHGLAQRRAEAAISWHGWEAAELMVGYLTGRRVGLLTKLTVIRTITLVQDRGCSLKGTAAERALETFLEAERPESQEAFFARSALNQIKSDVFDPTRAEVLKGGPCEASWQARQKAPQ